MRLEALVKFAEEERRRSSPDSKNPQAGPVRPPAALGSKTHEVYPSVRS
jgi:hypothetical protein